MADKTKQEMEAGLCSGYHDKHWFDEQYGVGQWRGIPRYPIEQAGDYRCIDDCKRAELNEATDPCETIVCVSPEFLALITMSFLHFVLHLTNGIVPVWLLLDGAIEDMWKGYRQIPCLKAELPFLIFCFVHPSLRRLVFCQLFGLPFGAVGAVTQFNRTPMWLTAIARRMFAIMGGHYFDDNAHVDLRGLKGQSQRILRRVCSAVNIVLSDSKAIEACGIVPFLGFRNDLCFVHEGFTVVGPKLGYREKVVALTDRPIESKRMSSGQASSLRGSMGPLDVGLFGRVCRGATSALIARQYYESTLDVHGTLLDSLQYVRTTVQRVQDRVIPIGPSPSMPVVIYSDASLEAGILTIGAVCFPVTGRPQAFTWVVPHEIVQLALRGDYNINKGELLAAPVAIWTFAHHLYNKDITWFIDNSAALASLIKSSSPKETMAKICLVSHMALSKLVCRPWFEWVDSASNVADPLSRKIGFADPWVQLQDWEEIEPVQPVWRDLQDLSFELLWSSCPG